MKYSIIIPTCNKHLTEMCLSYLAKVNKPKDDYEVLVITNATKEDFSDTIALSSTRIPNLKYFREEAVGLLAGRHRGAKEARGEILCYLDDDSFVDKDYLLAIEDTFTNTDVVFAGGNNIPLYESEPPQWLSYFWNDSPYGRLLCELSLIDFKQTKMKLLAWFVFGCNFIIKKNTLIEFGGFNPDCVPQSNQRFQGDGETALSCKLNQKGYVAHFNPKIQIQHYVPASRMTLDYFKKRGFYQGVCDSFSKIRQENGFAYFDFAPNSQVDQVKPSFLRRKFNKLIRKPITKLMRIFDPAYREYKAIQAAAEKSYQEGFDFHQNEVKNDPELRNWILRESYLEEPKCSRSPIKTKS